jgi:hypothetical protein
MDNTIIQQGSFTSTGASVRLNLRSDVDWMMVYNLTQGAASQTTAVGVKHYWQRGFAQGAKWTTFKSNAAAAANLEQYITSSGFTLLDTSVQTPGPLQATITAISNATIPVVTNSGTNGLAAGDVVRLFNVASAQQLGGIDFTVGYNTLSATTFSLDYMTQIVAGTTGSWRRIPFNPIFYPRRRFITEISVAAQAVVTLSVTHEYTVGQQIRFVVPAAYGMVEIDGMVGNIVAINTTTTSGNTVTVDINTSTFTAFTFPLSAAVPFSPAEVVPVGEDTATALAFGQDILADATINTSIIGMNLAGGANNPAGAAADTMFWVAGKSFFVDTNADLAS